ncbi:hypothetical protein GCM10020295_17190 [Streptomyces cinereospinus]
MTRRTGRTASAHSDRNPRRVGGHRAPGRHPAHQPPYLPARTPAAARSAGPRAGTGPRLRCGDQGADRPGRLSRRGHPAGVAAEGLDGVVHPPRGGEPVARAGAAGASGNGPQPSPPRRWLTERNTTPSRAKARPSYPGGQDAP